MTQLPDPAPVHITYLDRLDIEALALTDTEILTAIEGSLTDIMSKLVVDDWGRCKGGKLGALRAHAEAGPLNFL